MADTKTLLINDVEFAIGPCLQCGLSASEDEALKALAEWNEWLGERPSCAVCGSLFRMVTVILDHKVVGGDPGLTIWRVGSVTFTDCVNLTGLGGTSVRVHGACGRTVMPHADWGSMDGTSHTEEGRGPKPWDTHANREIPHGNSVRSR